jgi:hypothetical protein
MSSRPAARTQSPWSVQLVGVQVGELAARYELEVSDELATIVPDQAGWFFERFEP